MLNEKKGHVSSVETRTNVPECCDNVGIHEL